MTAEGGLMYRSFSPIRRDSNPLGYGIGIQTGDVVYTQGFVFLTAHAGTGAVYGSGVWVVVFQISGLPSMVGSQCAKLRIDISSSFLHLHQVTAFVHSQPRQSLAIPMSSIYYFFIVRLRGVFFCGTAVVLCFSPRMPFSSLPSASCGPQLIIMGYRGA